MRKRTGDAIMSEICQTAPRAGAHKKASDRAFRAKKECFTALQAGRTGLAKFRNLNNSYEALDPMSDSSREFLGYNLHSLWEPS
jgi:hypothetical protein